MTGQTNLFDDVLKQDERFVIVVQSAFDSESQLVKKTLREYTSLTREQMQSLFDHLKDLYLNEPFEENQVFYDITVYTNQDYAADQVYAHIKRKKFSREWTHTSK